MVRSKFEIYMEDKSRYIQMVQSLPICAAHRERIASMHRELSAIPDTADESEQNRRKAKAVLLCKAEGLLKNSVEEENEQGESKIMEATADDWKPSHIRLLAAAGADVNAKTTDGTAPIIKAAWCGHTAAVKELHSLGADVKAADNNGTTAVINAAIGGHTATVKALPKFTRLGLMSRLPPTMV
jgi:ankyrin repeat protein